MAEELSEKLKSLLSDPEAMNMFGSLLTNSANSDNSSTNPSGEDEFAKTIKNAVSRINNGGDKRINLLNALRPYMKESRVSNIDKAVKMLKLTQLTSIFKDL